MNDNAIKLNIVRSNWVLSPICSLCLAVCLGGIAGCHTLESLKLGPINGDNGNTVVQYANMIARDISQNLHFRKFNRNEDTIFITTYADVNDLKTSTDFGRTLTDCMISFLSQEGFQIVEFRKANSIYIEEAKGEYLLSRGRHDINDKLRAHASVVGTYSTSNDTLIVNTRLISLKDGKVLSTSSKEIPMTQGVQDLLTGRRRQGAMAVYEREPK